MKKSFVEKILRNMIVDTKRYRYIVRNEKIQRKPLEEIGRTTDWETIIDLRKADF